MITIYTTCRNSKKWPLYGIIQYNAIKSWTLLKPRPQILVMGTDPGSEDLCKELDVTYVPDVEVNVENVPIIPSMIKIAEKMSTNDVLALCSSDIILFQDVIATCKAMANRPKELNEFCGMAIKFNKKINQKINFSGDWRKEIKKNTWSAGAWAGDYFLHNKGYWKEDMPPFVIGRARCDNWMVWYGVVQRGCLVNMTEALTIIHHSHEKFETNGRGEGLTNTPGFKNNQKFYKIKGINDAPWKMNKDLKIVNVKQERLENIPML